MLIPTSQPTMDTIASGLNEAQKAAVTSPASVIQILAPPGSGKTKTLTSRVSYLLQYHSYRPWDVICLTFTIKSAREMRERIAKLIGNGLESKITLGTFHSVCLRYLRSYGHLIGLRKGFGIADSSDSQAIITRIIKQLKLSAIDARAARSRISSCKARNNSREDVRTSNPKKKNVDQEEFVAVFEAYENHLETCNLLDYDDLLLRCVQLLRLHPDCVSNVQAVLIDEFQDTNHVQFELMTLFASAKKRITTVGDPDQSIYGWRSAEVTNLSKMQRVFPETLVIHLEDNYRSSGSILLAALEVIQQDGARPDKPLLPTHCPGTIPTLRHLPHAAAEAQWIVSEIKRCIALTGDQLLTHSDFAILLRSASLSRQVESVMGRIGMPYRMVGGARFFDRAEIKILLDYLRVINQPDNTEALARILNVPARRVGDTTIKALLKEASTKSITLWTLVQNIVRGGARPQAKIASVAEKGLSSFYNIIRTAQKKILGNDALWNPKEIIQHIIDKLEFKSYLERHHPEDHENRWANVEELMAQASDSQTPASLSDGEDADDALPTIEGVDQAITNGGEASLSRFLENVALSTELQHEDDAVDETGREQTRVTISTIHAAKGLEWPVVFVPSVYQGSIPHSRAEDCDEERRLLYVAMTRAQALLYLSCPKRNSTGEETMLSPFVSTKQVDHYLTDRGPSIQHDTVRDISRILKRNCPASEALLKGLKYAENAEDTLWPFDGTESPDAAESRWNSGGTSTYQHAGQKRRNAEDLSSSRPSFRPASTLPLTTPLNTTMSNRSSFMIAPHQAGFVSAASHLRQHSTSFQRSRSVPESAVYKPSNVSKAFSKGQDTTLNSSGPRALSTDSNTLSQSDRPATIPCELTSVAAKSKKAAASLAKMASKRQKTSNPSNQGTLSTFFKPLPPAPPARSTTTNLAPAKHDVPDATPQASAEHSAKTDPTPAMPSDTSHPPEAGRVTSRAPMAPLPASFANSNFSNPSTEPARKSLGMRRPLASGASGPRPFKPPISNAGRPNP